MSQRERLSAKRMLQTKPSSSTTYLLPVSSCRNFVRRTCTMYSSYVLCSVNATSICVKCTLLLSCSRLKFTTVYRAVRGVLVPFVFCRRVTQTYDCGACVYFYMAINSKGLADPVAAADTLEVSGLLPLMYFLLPACVPACLGKPAWVSLPG